MELEYRFATADDIENLMQTRLDMLRVVNDLGPDYVFDDDFVRSSRDYFLNGDQISVLAVCGDKTVGCASICFIEIMPSALMPQSLAERFTSNADSRILMSVWCW